MATRIVFVGGTHVDVETPIQNPVRLFEEAGRSGLSFASAVDASMPYIVNREQIVYLEAIPDRGEKPFWVQASEEAEVTRKLSVGIAGLIGHLPTAAPDWRLLAVGAAAPVPGALLGARLTGRLSEAQLVRAIGLALLVAGTAAALQALL